MLDFQRFPTRVALPPLPLPVHKGVQEVKKYRVGKKSWGELQTVEILPIRTNGAQ